VSVVIAAGWSAGWRGQHPIEARPDFSALLARIAGNGAHTIIVETANRFARDLMVQEVGFAMLRERGVTLTEGLCGADGWPELIDMAAQLRGRANGRHQSLRKIAAISPSGVTSRRAAGLIRLQQSPRCSR
jgi:hypothetical protein